MNEKESNKKKWLPFLTMMLLAVMAELFLFNFRYFQSMLYTELSYPVAAVETEQALLAENGTVVFEEDATGRFYLTGLDQLLGEKELHNIRLDWRLADAQEDPGRESGICSLQCIVRDEGHDRYVTVGTHILRPEIVSSRFLWIQGYGKIKTIVLDATLSEGNRIQIDGITINARQPLALSGIRCLIVFLLLCMIWGLRKSSSVWTESIKVWDRKKTVLVVVIGLVFLLPAAYLIFENEQILQDRHFRPYQNLAEAFEAGQLHLLTEPGEALKQMENPYDYTARTGLGLVEGRDYLWDTVYYNGHYYVYFGVIPCLLFYWPVYHFTGMHLPDAVTIFLSAVFGYAGIFLAVREWCRRREKEISFGHLLLMYTAVFAGSMIPDYLGTPDPHDVPRITGIVFLAWGLYLWQSASGGKEEQKTEHPVRLALGSLCMALAVGCRPNLAIYSFLALFLFGKQFRKLLSEKKGYGFLCTLLLPYVPVAVGLMIYNAMRFSSPFDFGAAYNLTVQDCSKISLFADSIVGGLYEFLLRLPRFDYDFPFLKSGGFAQQNPFGHGDYYYTYGYCGLLICNPVLWCVPAALISMIRRKRKEYDYGMCALLILGSVNLLVNIAIAGIAYHYMMDFAGVFAAAGWMAAFYVRKGCKGETARRLFDGFLVFSLLASLWFHLNFYFVSSLPSGNTLVFYKIFYGVHFW